MTEALLIEIGVEELPAIPLLKIVTQIEKSWKSILESYQLSCDFEFFYTPRRLVLRHKAIRIQQEDSTVELFGPPLSAALKEGIPTKAAEGFARKCTVSFESLGSATKNGKEVLYFKKEEQGNQTVTLLQEMLEKWLASMSFGKMMRWGNHQDEFIRPLRWLQVRMGNTSVPVELYAVKSATHTYVHRMVSYDAQEVATIEAYDEVLKNAAVTLLPSKRKETILADFIALEKEHGIEIERDSGLLNEVVAITENPKALLGSFDTLFLELPPEVIITSMKEHQRYFPVFKDGKISNHFVVVSNAYTNDYTQVIEGNERVLKPRLADGLFFYKNDLKNGLSIEGLDKVQFIDGLGTLKDKINREKKIALHLLALYSDTLKTQTSKSNDTLISLMDKSVSLAKADLMSEMVYEFTELQGLMGYYYAKALGEEALVYTAIKEQYMPVGEGAELPSSVFSAIVSMAVKLDTLFGLFSVGKIPTGSKDPFALRRALNGIVRIVIAYDLPFNMKEIFTALQNEYQTFDTNLLYQFMIERIKKSLDANPSVIAAVFASGENDINEVSKKVVALNSIVNNTNFKEQFTTFKRVANISKDSDLTSTLSINTALFKEEAETILHEAYLQVIATKYTDYSSELEALFGLKEPLDRYFDTVMVNATEKDLQANRLNMIASVYQTFRKIADIKEITV